MLRQLILACLISNFALAGCSSDDDSENPCVGANCATGGSDGGVCRPEGVSCLGKAPCCAGLTCSNGTCLGSGSGGTSSGGSSGTSGGAGSGGGAGVSSGGNAGSGSGGSAGSSSGGSAGSCGTCPTLVAPQSGTSELCSPPIETTPTQEDCKKCGGGACGLAYFYACSDEKPPALNCQRISIFKNSYCCEKAVCVRNTSLDAACSGTTPKFFYCHAETIQQKLVPANCKTTSAPQGYCCP